MTDFADDDRLTTLSRYLSAVEAEVLVAALNERGIAARTEGGDLATTLSYVGTAIGGARVIVAERHVKAAEALLAELADADEGTTSFPPDFDYGDDSPQDLQEVTDSQTAVPSHIHQDARQDALVERVFRLSLLSVVMLPPLLTFYSCWLLLSCRPAQLSDPMQWRYRVAVAINLLVVLACTALLVAILNQPGLPPEYERIPGTAM